MKKVYNLVFVLAVPALFVLFSSGTMWSTQSPGNKTGSPGDGGANCTECHAGTPIEEDYWILNSDLLLWGYQPGETYMITVIGVDGDAGKFGFEATVEDASGNPVGTLQNMDPTRTQLINSNTSITHTFAGTVPLADTGTIWFFNWVAPATAVGNIGFYAAINAANGNGNNSGDQVHLSSFMASPSVGIAEQAQNQSFSFYPNPSNGSINLTNNKADAVQEIEIYSISGQLVHQTVLSANQSVKANLNHLDKGVYIIKTNDYSDRLVIR
jgi:hypothetical protein